MLLVIRHGTKDPVEAPVALLRLAAVALDPFGHEVEHLCFEVNGAALGVTAPADDTGVLEHPEVLGDGLHGHVIGLGKLADDGVPVGEAGHDVPSDRVRKSR